MVAVRELLSAAVETAEEEAEEEEQVQKETRHVPDQLRTIPDGGFRTVSKTIATGKVVAPGKPGWRKNPRMRNRAKYRRATEQRNAQLHKRGTTGSGFYHGQISGIDPTKRASVKLRPPH
jgi:hypothetical protein